MSVFVAAFVIPFLFFLFSLSLDLSKYFTETQQAQKAADDAALYAYRFLPYSTKAALAARNYLSSAGSLAESAEISADSYSVSIAINTASDLSFARFFGLQAGIPIAAYARAWGSPLDVYIAVDSSAVIAPAVPDGAAWGDPQQWPAAGFFELHGPSLAGDVRADLLTQRCFNPAFSAIKYAAIWTYDYLSASPHNAVGVGFYPGVLSALDVAREVVPGGAVAAGRGEALLGTQQNTLYGRHEWCAAAAEAETFHEQYRFPEFSTVIPRLWDPENGRPASMIEGPNWSFNADYQPHLQAREVIWSRAASEVSDGSAGGPSISAVLRDISGKLLAAPTVSSRRALAGRPRKSAIIFAGALPREEDGYFPSAQVQAAMMDEFAWIREQVQTWKTNMRILYVLFPHPGNESGDFVNGVERLQEFFDSQSFDSNGSNPPDFEVSLVFATNPQELKRQVPALLLLERKAAMLAR